MIDKIKQYKTKHQHLMTRLKHLRGKHDQLDHAWNRGMGQGGGGVGLVSNQMGPLPTADFYRKRRIELMDQQRQGTITRAEMRQQMRDLRGITIDALETNQESELTLANRRGSSKPTPGQLAFDFGDKTSVPTDVIQKILQMSVLNNFTDLSETQQFLNDFINLSLDNVSYYSYIQNAQKAVKNGIAPGSLQLKKYATPATTLSVNSLYEGMYFMVNDLLKEVNNLRGHTVLAGTTAPDLVSEQILNTFLSTIGPDYDMLDQKFGISTWSLGSEDTTPQEEKAKKLRSEIQKSKQKMSSLLLNVEKEQENYAILADLGNQTSLRHHAMTLEAQNPANTPAQQQIYSDIADQLYDQLCIIEQELNTIEQKIAIPMSLISAEFDQLMSDWHGGETIPPEYLAMLTRHGGRSINSTMQSASYQPYITPDPNIFNLQQVLNDFQDKVNDANKFLDLMVDERLLSDVNPDVLLSETSGGESAAYIAKLQAISVSSTDPVSIILHELFHGITQTDKIMPNLFVDPEVLVMQGIMPPLIYVKDRSIKLRLNQLVSGFVKKRMQKTPGVTELVNSPYSFVLDDFTDYYMGMIRFTETKIRSYGTPVQLQYQESLFRDNAFPEVLTMGVTLMLTDPAGFARKDPEYYRFMCVILSGAWI